MTFNAGLFTYMFSSFYIKSYSKKPSKTDLDAIADKYNKKSIAAGNGVGAETQKLNGLVDGAVSSKESLNAEVQNGAFKKKN